MWLMLLFSGSAGAASRSEPIPMNQLGTIAGQQVESDGLSVIPTTEGALLRCAFQKLEGHATPEGLWLTSMAEGANGERFRLVAVAVGREGNDRSELPPGLGLRWQSGVTTPLSGAPGVTETKAVCAPTLHPPHSKTPSDCGADAGRGRQLECAGLLPSVGQVIVTEQLVRFIRPGLTEEYSVSVDGVRQDFVVLEKPGGAGVSVNREQNNGEASVPASRKQYNGGASVPASRPAGGLTPPPAGELRLELSVTGAVVEATVHGARLVLPCSGRKIAYSRLRVTDATGKELPARMEVRHASSLAWRAGILPP